MEIQHSGSLDGLDLSQNQMLSLAGEALLKESGSSWNADKGVWDNTGDLSLTLTDNILKGNIMGEVNNNGGFDYSTVTSLVTRDIESYKGWSVYEGIKGSEKYQGLDSISITKRDLDNNIIASSLFNGYHTVDNMTKNKNGDDLNQPYSHPTYGNIQGNTIAPGSFGMTYFGNSGFSGNIGSVNNAVIVLNNAKTLSGLLINSTGHSGSDPSRWLTHSLRQDNTTSDFKGGYLSDGCFTGPYATVQNMFNTMNAWGMQQGYQINTSLNEINRFKYSNLMY